jgi:hypothetical protein
MSENKYETRLAHMMDVHAMAPFMRQQDIDEIKSSHGVEPHEALKIGLECSNHCRVGVANGVPVVMYGVSPHTLLSDHGTIWMLSTDAMTPHWRKFLRECQSEISIICHGFKHVENWVDQRNTVSLHWLRWMGFSVEDAPQPYGIYQMPFYHFTKDLDLCATSKLQ